MTAHRDRVDPENSRSPDDIQDQIQSPLLVEEGERITHLSLNRAYAHNALDEALLQSLVTALKRVGDQPDTRVIVLSGQGADFCTGADVAQLTHAGDDESGHELSRLLDLGRQVCQGLADAAPITIARVHGRVIGAGLALAMHCDLRVSAADTTFRLPELSLGIPPVWGGATSRFLTEIGAARLREMILLGEVVDASTAAGYGIVHRLAADEQALDDLVSRWSRRLVLRDPVATSIAKRTLAASQASSRLGDLSVFDDDLFRIGIRRQFHND